MTSVHLMSPLSCRLFFFKRSSYIITYGIIPYTSQTYDVVVVIVNKAGLKVQSAYTVGYRKRAKNIIQSTRIVELTTSLVYLIVI